MPKEMHDKLKKQAEKKGLTGQRKQAYIFGTMRRTGWKPKREKRKTLLTGKDG